MKAQYLLLAILLSLISSACVSIPATDLPELTPEQCRMYGVAVHDRDTITGKVVKSECKTFAGIEQECGTPMVGGLIYQGCAIGTDGNWPSGTGEYEIYYADCPRSCAVYHEWCHAGYEQSGHTVNFNLRLMQGDQFAACP